MIEWILESSLFRYNDTCRSLENARKIKTTKKTTHELIHTPTLRLTIFLSVQQKQKLQKPCKKNILKRTYT